MSGTEALSDVFALQGELHPGRVRDGDAPRRRRFLSTLSRVIAAALREPIVHFLVAGLLLVLANGYVRSQSERYMIKLGPPEIKRIALTYQQQFGSSPDDRQLATLADRYVQDEIFVREGLALGLDQGDEIVRRRIAQKFDFLQQDLSVPDAPTEAQLRTFFVAHRSSYLTPARVSFTQVYFSPDRDGDEAALRRAQEAFAALRGSALERAPHLGDAFPGQIDNTALSQDDLVRVFGDSELAGAATELPAGSWLGPYRSGYGYHLVYVTERRAPSTPDLDEVRGQVLKDYADAVRRVQNAKAFDALRAKYRIVRPGGER